MKSANGSKGITPVIAIVLLLLITVGAVGVVYTQFQSLVEGNDAEERLNQQQEVQQASYDIVGLETPSATEFTVTLQNTGDNEVNFDDQSTTVLFGVNSTDPQAAEIVSGGTPCTWSSVAPSPGETTQCTVNLDNTYRMYDDAISETVQFQLESTTKSTYNCNYDGGPTC